MRLSLLVALRRESTLTAELDWHDLRGQGCPRYVAFLLATKVLILLLHDKQSMDVEKSHTLAATGVAACPAFRFTISITSSAVTSSRRFSWSLNSRG